jgi:hypothetical protein
MAKKLLSTPQLAKRIGIGLHVIYRAPYWEEIQSFFPPVRANDTAKRFLKWHAKDAADIKELIINLGYIAKPANKKTKPVQLDLVEAINNLPKPKKARKIKKKLGLISRIAAVFNPSILER